MATINKRYLYKVYSAVGHNFLGLLPQPENDFTLSEEINTYGSSVELEIPVNSDSVMQKEAPLTTQAGVLLTTENGLPYTLTLDTKNQIGPGTLIDDNLKVEVYVYYGREEQFVTQDNMDFTTQDGQPLMASLGAPNGLCKFRGYISRFNSRYGDTENTHVSLLSDGDQLKNYIIEEAGDTKVFYNDYEPGAILKNIIDKIAASSDMRYGAGTIANTATIVDYTFNTNTTEDGVKKITELAPPNWYGYLDMGTNEIYLQPKPTIVSHTFILGKHLEKLDLERSLEGIVNTVYFIGGEISPGVNLLRKYEDAASIALYGRKLRVMTDQRVTDPTSADVLALNEIEQFKMPRYKTELVIIDQLYDIETIRPGQLVQFRNFGNYIDLLKLQVVGIRYEPDKVTLQLDTLMPEVNKRVTDLKRNLDAINAMNNPVEPQT